MRIAENDFLKIYIERILPHVVVNGDCCECTIGDNGNGYRHVHVRPKVYSVHRITYTVYFGEIPEGLNVLHRCDNRACCNPYHLFVGTQRDNMRDKMRKGRAVGPKLLGESNPSAKLTREKVERIRSSKDTQRILAERYGVSQVLIGKIKRYEIWI